GLLGVAQVAARGDAVADAALELGQVGEAALLLARPDRLALGADLEHAAVAGHERDLAELGRERRQELLRHPSGAQEPPALGAVLDLDARLRHGMQCASRRRGPYVGSARSAAWAEGGSSISVSGIPSSGGGGRRCWSQSEMTIWIVPATGIAPSA